MEISAILEVIVHFRPHPAKLAVLLTEDTTSDAKSRLFSQTLNRRPYRRLG